MNNKKHATLREAIELIEREKPEMMDTTNFVLTTVNEDMEDAQCLFGGTGEVLNKMVGYAMVEFMDTYFEKHHEEVADWDKELKDFERHFMAAVKAAVMAAKTKWKYKDDPLAGLSELLGELASMKKNKKKEGN